MTVISDNKLVLVATELLRRNVKLRHACQLTDLRSYLTLGGIPSRNLLTERGLSYTGFDTDVKDQQNGVWKLVFFNLSDFGYWFAQGKNTIPNPFGPVLLSFDPTVICGAVDVSITLRSPVAESFDRITEGISVDDVCRLFTDTDSSYVRFANALREEFGRPEAQSLEVNCVFHEELAPLSHLVHIVVDPYSFHGIPLVEIVRREVLDRDDSCRVYERRCAEGCRTRYQILLDSIIGGVRTAFDLARAIPDGSPLESWRDHLMSNKNLLFQFERYATYLADGTIRYCV